MQHLKAVQPKLKLNVMLHSESAAAAGEPQNFGYVLLDMRDLTREISQQTFKIHGMNGAELQVSAKLNTVMHAKLFPTSSSSEPKIIGSAAEGDAEGGSTSVTASVAASTDSMRSVLRLALGGDRAQGRGAMVRFSMAISLEDYCDLGSLCRRVLEEDAASAVRQTYPPPARTFWLCWTLFDKLFKSEEFVSERDGPTRVRDTIRVECPLHSLPSSFSGASPLRIYLCSQERLIASADVPLPTITPELCDRDDVSVSQSGWGYMCAPYGQSTPYSEDRPTQPAVKIGVHFTIESVVPAPNAGEDRAAVGDAEGQDYDNDDFEEEGGEGEEKSGGTGKAVHFQLEPPQPQPPRPPTQGTEALHLTEEAEDGLLLDGESEEQLRHFRVSLEVRSIGGLKRPAHISLSFAYPYLGSSAPIRTHPIWVLANSEARIDGAAASYECCMSRENLRETLRLHPLKIAAHARSQMGSTAMGDINVDLAATLRSAPHSFRCPVSNRIFKTRAEYSRHRQTMLALRSAGRVPSAPPAEPVIIRATDAYLVFANASGGGAADGSKARVVVIVEDIGMVGPEMGVGVQSGYKMHGGGLYVSDEHDTASLSAPDGSTAEAARDPLLRADLTPDERSRLEMLKLEWDAWRRGTEAQWRDALRDKETQTKKRLEIESAAVLASRADDLRRAHEEAGRLEVRLRSAIDAAERQKSQLTIKEEQMHMRLAQKTAELQLLQKRVRDEAKVRVDGETRRADSLQQQIDNLQGTLERTEKRARDTEKDYEVRAVNMCFQTLSPFLILLLFRSLLYLKQYRHQARSMPESLLREECAKLKAQLAESRSQVERERRIRSEAELEKEHFRSQMHRLALALKRERDKSATIARQELEQLRLEFLAREERYILDGDRDELRTIRFELANLRAQSPGQQPIPLQPPLVSKSGSSIAYRLQNEISVLLASGYDESDGVVQHLRNQLAHSGESQ